MSKDSPRLNRDAKVRKGWYWFIAWVARRIAFNVLGGTRVIGLENVPKDGPVLIAPNHVSHLDPPLVGCTCPRLLKFMAKEELFRVPVLSPLIRSLGAFPVKRGANDTAAIRKTLDWLESGEAVLMFPEGQRGDGKTMGAVLPGIAVLAKKTKAQIVPVGVSGTEIVMPRGKAKGRRHTMTIVYGEPFTYEDTLGGPGEENDRQRFANVLAARIAGTANLAGLDVKICGSNLSQEPSLPIQKPS